MFLVSSLLHRISVCTVSHGMQLVHIWGPKVSVDTMLPLVGEFMIPISRPNISQRIGKAATLIPSSMLYVHSLQRKRKIHTVVISTQHAEPSKAKRTQARTAGLIRVSKVLQGRSTSRKMVSLFSYHGSCTPKTCCSQSDTHL